jgi:hypothetical protein
MFVTAPDIPLQPPLLSAAMMTDIPEMTPAAHAAEALT